MKFNVEVYEKLTGLVRIHPCLYDASLQDYKDHNRQKNIWKAIAKELGKECMKWANWKKVWKQKRNGFTKKRRDIVSCKSGSAAKKIRKGPLYDQMAFLADHISGKSTVSNLVEEDILHSSDGEKAHDSDSDMEENSHSDISHEPDAQRSSPATPVPAEDTTSQENMTSNESQATASLISSGSREATQHSAGRTRTPATPKANNPAGGRGKKKNELVLDSFIEKFNQRSTTNMDSIEKIATKLAGESDDANIYTYLSKKTSSFSKATQEWMEDEVLGIYMQAKKRERQQDSSSSTTTTCTTDAYCSDPLAYMQQYQPTSSQLNQHQVVHSESGQQYFSL